MNLLVNKNLTTSSACVSPCIHVDQGIKTEILLLVLEIQVLVLNIVLETQVHEP
jgi:hypothetical protein